MSAVFESPFAAQPDPVDWREQAARERPTNYARNLYHAANGVFVSWLVMEILNPLGMVLVAGGIALLAWIFELSRRRIPAVNRVLMTLFGPVAHPHEYASINSGTWIMTGLTTLALFFDPLCASIGIVVVGFADPSAAVVGRSWGRTRLVGNRTLEGSLAFFVVGSGAVVVLLKLYAPQVDWPSMALIAGASALFGALAELYAPLDDNLSVPIAAASAGAFAMWIVGLAPSGGWLVNLLLS